jgi:hypothetical protein
MGESFVDSEFPWEPQPAALHPDHSHEPRASEQSGTAD